DGSRRGTRCARGRCWRRCRRASWSERRNAWFRTAPDALMAATTPAERCMRLTVVITVLALTVPALAQQQPPENEVVPVTGFIASEGAQSCMSDICGTVPIYATNAMSMPQGQWMILVSAQRQQFIGASDGHGQTGTSEIIGQGFTMAPRKMT